MIASMLMIASVVLGDVNWNDQLRVDDIANNSSQFLTNCFTVVNDTAYVGANCLSDAFYQTPMYVSPNPNPLNKPVIVTTMDATSVYLVDQPCVLVDQMPWYGGTAYAVVCGDDIFNDNLDRQ